MKGNNQNQEKSHETTNPQSSKHIKIYSKIFKKSLEHFTVNMIQEINKSESKNSTSLIQVPQFQQKKQEKPNEHQESQEISEILSQNDFDKYKCSGQNFKRMQPRFKDIPIYIPNLPRSNKDERSKRIRSWLGIATKQIFSVGFNYFQIKQLEEKDIKIYCSENLLSNILKMAQINQVTIDQLEMMNNVLKKQLLPYYSLKYPHSTEPEVNLAFASKIIQTDNFNSNDNDLIQRSKINFDYEKDENYNPQIMQFINFLLDLYQKKIMLENGKERHLATLFEQQMLSLFERIQLQDQAKLMALFNPKIAGFEESTSSNSKLQDPDKYRQKVRSYTDYLIGRKISKDIRNFSEDQISQGYLKLRIPSIMRIVTKWCDELLNYFTNDQFVLNRSEQFRMRDKSQHFLNKTYRKILYQLLQRQYKKIKLFLSEIMRNNIQSQKYFSKFSKNEKLDIYSQSESSVGLFSSAIRENCEHYQLGYLNRLIHGLLTVNQQFLRILCLETQQPMIFKKYITKAKTLEEIEKDMQDNFPDYLIQNYRKQMQKKIPEFISFKIGDLLRCRCFSKEKQIIALYCELQQISHFQKQRMKIVRVKNKLQKGTKDILINIMFYDSILVEIQLGINEKQSDFSICASKFQHYIYELQRASFGPISQLCNVWWSLDERGQFYRSKLIQLNLRIPQQNIQHKCYQSMIYDLTLKSLKIIIDSEENPAHFKKITLPFVCEYCRCYYTRIMPLEKHLNCQKCFKNICFMCYLDSCSKNHTFKEHKTIPDRGQLLYLKSKNRQYKLFKAIKRGRNTFLFQVVNPSLKIFRLLKEINSDQRQNKFLRENIVLSSEEVNKKLKDIDNTVIYKHYDIPQLLKKYNQKKVSSIALVGEDISDFIFEKIKNIQYFPFVEKVSLGENLFTKFAGICKKFRYAKIIQLDHNEITSITSECKLLTRLEELNLSENPISFVHDNIGSITNLAILNLSCNKYLRQLPESLGNLQQLQKLDLSGCLQLTHLPSTIGKLKILQYLNLDNCQSLIKLPDSLTQLSLLIQLILDCCIQLRQLPKQIGNLKNLQILKLNQCLELESLPQSLSKMNHLKVLQMQNCQNLLSVPENIQKSLQLLILSNSQVKILSKNLGEGLKFKTIKIHELNLQSFDLKFSEYSNIRLLDLSECIQIKYLPNSICKLQRINYLNLRYCKNIEQLPENIGQLKNLEFLNLSFCYKLRKLPQSIMKLQRLEQIFLESCFNLEDLSYGFGCLPKIQQLQLQKNHSLKQLPFTFGVYLQKLNISLCSSLKQFPYSFANASQLTQFSIKNCRSLENIGQSLNQLTQLRNFQIHNCPSLIKIHESLSMTPKLQVMEVKKCHLLQKFPVINEKLKVLKISYCRNLKKINISSDSPKKIETLIIQFCQQIQDLCECCRKLQNLVNLQIIYCPSFLTLPSHINQLISLKSVKLNGCSSILSLPESFGNIENLVNLQIQDCSSMRELCHNFGALKKLQVLQLKKLDYLLMLPQSLGQCQELQTFKLCFCGKITRLPSTLQNLHQLKFFLLKQNKGLTQIPKISNNKLLKLKYFSIIGCTNINKIGSSQIRNLKTLKIIDNQQLMSLPCNFSELKKLIKVDLIKCVRLEQIPECFQQLRNLEYLTIKYCNQLKQIPKQFFKNMENLKQFTIVSCNKVKQLPDNFQCLKKLQKLMIHNLPAMKKVSETLGMISNLKVLDISDCLGLQGLPDGLNGLKQLSVLIFVNNPNVTLLPTSLGQLIKLKQLCLQRNSGLTSLPSNLFLLQNLSILDLRRCINIQIIPELPSSLQILQLGQGIRSLNQNINTHQLKSLAIFNASFLRTLPKNINNMENLSDLVLRNCCLFKEFPEEICDLNQLRVLQFTGGNALPNNIEEYIGDKKLKEFLYQPEVFFTRLPDAFGNLQNLEILILRQCNYLAQLPESFSDLQSLKILDLTSAGSLKRIPIKKDSKMNLQILKCNQCYSLETLPNCIAKMKDIIRIELKQCSNLQILPDSLGLLNTNLQYLDLAFCSKLKKIPSKLKLAQSLQYLNLTGLKELKQLDNDFFIHLKNIEELYFRGCHILHSIPTSLTILRKMKILYITDCWKITQLPNLLDNLLNLQHLCIEKCYQLTSLGNNLGNITSLKYLLLLQLPKLKKLPKAFEKFKDTKFDDLKIDLNMSLLYQPEKQIVNQVVASFICRKSSILGFQLASAESQISQISYRQDGSPPNYKIFDLNGLDNAFSLGELSKRQSNSRKDDLCFQLSDQHQTFSSSKIFELQQQDVKNDQQLYSKSRSFKRFPKISQQEKNQQSCDKDKEGI